MSLLRSLKTRVDVSLGMDARPDPLSTLHDDAAFDAANPAFMPPPPRTTSPPRLAVVVAAEKDELAAISLFATPTAAFVPTWRCHNETLPQENTISLKLHCLSPRNFIDFLYYTNT